MKISILDQSPISEGETAAEALQKTVELAILAEKLGYERFWVSEHHDASTLAGSSPEVLLAHLAAKTASIQIGSGGVMLPHYSAYKVAENFKMLAALAPGRINLGVGRAPGGMPRASFALSDGRKRDKDRYPEQIDDLLAYLYDQSVPHPYTGVKATPLIDVKPDVWVLGSSLSSAQLAAEKGLPYTFAKFINGDGGQSEMAEYRRLFQPSAYLDAPKANIAVFLICAETDEDAFYLAGSLELALMMAGQGIPSNGTPSPEKAAAYQYGKFEQKHVQENRKRMVVGSAETVRKKLKQLSEEYGIEEVMAVTIIYDFEKKKRSFELLSTAIR